MRSAHLSKSVAVDGCLPMVREIHLDVHEVMMLALLRHGHLHKEFVFCGRPLNLRVPQETGELLSLTNNF